MSGNRNERGELREAVLNSFLKVRVCLSPRRSVACDPFISFAAPQSMLSRELMENA